MTDFLIEHECPQCGAPAILEETDRLISCEYCRVRSYLLAKDHFRLMLPHSAPVHKALLFFPYWRSRGMLFSCLSHEIRHKVVDFSHQAAESRHFPVSVGLRSQAMRLRFLSPETEGHFLKPTLGVREVMRLFRERFKSSLPEPALEQMFVSETFSLIYSPFYMDQKPTEDDSQFAAYPLRLYDAILNSPLPSPLPADFDLSLFPAGPPEQGIRLIPTLCPACGWDMEGKRDTLVLSCKNCDSIWTAGRERFERLTAAHIPGTGEGIRYMPFWRVKANVSEIKLNSYADLVRVANLPKVLRTNRDTPEFCFWAPGFRIRPRIFLNLSRNMTLSHPPENLIPGHPDGRCGPVTLPATAAARSLKVCLASFMKPRKRIPELLPKIKIRPKEFLLVYVPFQEKHHELVQPEFQLAVHQNMLR